MASSSLSLSLLFLGALTLVHAEFTLYDLRANDLSQGILGIVDGYVKVYCGPSYLGKTEVRKNNPDPWWSEKFSHFNAEQNNVLRMEVYDSDIFFDDLLGTCQRQIKTGTHQHSCFLEKGGALHYTYTLV